jgi:DNA-binding Lrp family transcriptional regulator
MVDAYILIKTMPGREREVFTHLHKILKTKQRDLVFGAYDIIIKLKAEDNEVLYRVINKKIRPSPDIANILVLTCYHLPETEKATPE